MFSEEVERVARIVRSIVKEKHVKIITHYDADGLTSGAILSRMLTREGVNFELKIIKQLTKSEVENLKIGENDFLILSDLGSGQLDLLKNVLPKTQVLIIDHHEPKKIEHLNLFHLNPLTLQEEEISASMISYLFAKSLNIKNVDSIDLAIVGAIADAQDEKWEFKGLAREILEEAETLGKITRIKGLRLYGRMTRPIHKVLEYSFDPFIPGISGSESKAVQFLSELGIKIKEDGEWRRLNDLSLEEQKKLASAIIIERLRGKHSDAEDIFGEVYLIPERPEEIQDAREFATLLNACGRLGRGEIGIRLCLGDVEAINDALQVLEEYRKLIGEAIDWVRKGEAVITKNYGTYIVARDKIPDTLIGTVTSILLNSNLVDASKPIFGLAETPEGKVKVSARASKDLKPLNLRDIIINATEKLEGEGGGHKFACGGLIPKGKEDKFIQTIECMLGEVLAKEKG